MSGETMENKGLGEGKKGGGSWWQPLPWKKRSMEEQKNSQKTYHRTRSGRGWRRQTCGGTSSESAKVRGRAGFQHAECGERSGRVNSQWPRGAKRGAAFVRFSLRFARGEGALFEHWLALARRGARERPSLRGKNEGKNTVRGKKQKRKTRPSLKERIEK